MTYAIARPATMVHGRLYWRGTRVRDQADVTLHQRTARTWDDRDEAVKAVDRMAPELWRMGYQVVEVSG